MRRSTALTIPQPCHESWDAMTPTATGRHCAACQKTVVDFTRKTDAEILAFLAGAASGRTCGRFAAGQLARPLQRAVSAAPTARWRAWLVAAVAVWAVREGVSPAAWAQAPAETRARYWGGPVPATLPVEGPPLAAKGSATTTSNQPAESREATMGAPLALEVQPLTIRGAVTDAATGEGVPGATVLVQGTTVGASTSADGSFQLPIPAELVGPAGVPLRVSFIGYVAQSRVLAADSAGTAQLIRLEADTKGLIGEIVVTSLYRALPPAPWHPRALFGWGKYWLTRPFRRW
ncbi:carboxypeptidase-like regulatory domain-containing protein [Hymenobacter ruricola]|uniref:Carboxypeptidase-like regulatory domain-containing protein n=1 Tax=Hymenobacter ruricola TaxID=2791023 RepID=A0ABS0I7G8_9BACT|nr:carboxypeptidase-like regulatory domain-containing protein [Hymenobacter ruricola]MBF9222875.1 carboxypeptidase-like regulatory domain-containing protein [Hymenobacter ruricola]